nr:hypothetical protein [Tanacetum cinerariifolium]
MVFMAKMEKVLSDSDESSSSAEETIVEVAYYTFESESESEYETSEYYDNSTNYDLFMNDNDDQEIFYDAIESASENFIETHIDSQKDYDKSEVNHNDSEEKEHLVYKLIQKFNHKIAKCQKLMSSYSHATITYTSMSSYEVIINGYYGMPMDPLDPYVQLVIGAPPSPDYIPGPEVPPSPEYIPGPEALPLPDYIPGPEYP